MGNWSYNPTYRSYNPIYNWKGAHLVDIQSYLLRFGVWMVHFWGPNTEPPQVIGRLGIVSTTLPETNISPENRPLEVWRFRTWKPSFLRAFAVSFREGIHYQITKLRNHVGHSTQQKTRAGSPRHPKGLLLMTRILMHFRWVRCM